MLQATRGDLGGLAGYLDARRPQVLQRWRDAVTGDASLDATSDWSLKQLNDHFPDVLEVLGNVLRCWPDLPVSVTTAEHDAAVAHARTRWLQGYSLRGVVREWGHLNSVVVDEIASFRPLASESGFHRIALAAWARVLNDQQALSALEYHELEQAEAETRGAELRRALDALRSIASDRGRAIESLASSMRNDLQVVMTTTSASREDETWHAAYALRKMSQEGFHSLDRALSDMVTLAHLEAGNETRYVESFDAGQGFVHLVDGLRHVAHHAGAELRGEGPANFVVQGDDERVRRLGTHLVFCALRSSRPGVVQVSWGALEGEPARWFLAVEHAVQEGGRGASSDAGRALARATDAAQQAEGVAPTGDEAALQEGVIPVAQGDGVNLLIAKHLCELLGAGLEVEAEADAGVLRYRASLPMAYGPT